METLLLLLASYGLCFGLMNDKAKFITNVLRWIPLPKDEATGLNFFGRMFLCPYCTGFHAGWVTWLLARAPIGQWTDADWAVEASHMFLFAFASSAFCYVVDTASARLERE